MIFTFLDQLVPLIAEKITFVELVLVFVNKFLQSNVSCMNVRSERTERGFSTSKWSENKYIMGASLRGGIFYFLRILGISKMEFVATNFVKKPDPNIYVPIHFLTQNFYASI